jgi:hypothetical protein
MEVKRGESDKKIAKDNQLNQQLHHFEGSIEGKLYHFQGQTQQ